MRIAIYSRKSKTTDTGDSINNQIAMCKNYANLHFPNSSFTIYEDEGFSGSNIERPMYKQLLNHIKNKKYDVLICYRLDRISRNVADFSNSLEILQENKVDFVSIKENFDTSTPMGRAMIYISSVFAQLERDTIAERISDNLLELAKTGSGRYLGGVPPFGFDKVKKINTNGKSYSILVVSPKESEVVRDIFDKYIELHSLRKLESYLFKNNIKTRNNSYFNIHKLGILLRRPNYAVADKAMYTYFKSLGTQISNLQHEFNGKYGISVFGRTGEGRGEISKLNSYDKWIVGVGAHNGIIESVKWLHVQKILDSRKGKKVKRTHSNYGLLNGLLRCSQCGDYMRPASIRKNGELFYYVCTTKELSRKAKCTIKNIRGDILDKELINNINTKLNDIEYKLKGLNKNQNLIKEKKYENNKKLNQLQAELKENNQSIDNLINKLSISVTPSIEKHISSKIDNLDKRNKEIEKQLIKINNDKQDIKLENSIIKIQDATEKIKSLNYSMADMVFKKNLLKTVIKEIKWDGENVNINFFY